MSIADKINSIRTHLETDYEALENIGAELENVDKNIENIASVVNGIYDNLPKTTGEDTSLSLTTLKGKMNIIPKGDTKQDSTTGINLMDVSAVGSGTRNGITLTNNGDGTFTLNGTATAQNLFTLANMTLDTSKTYTLTGCPSGGSSTTYFIAGANFGDYGSGATAIPNRASISFSIVTQNGVTLNNVVFKPMLIEGSTQRPFEKFTGGQASPNPSYPQDIEVVKGTQDVKVSGNEFAEIETQTLNDMKITKTDNGYILNGTTSANTTFRATITNPTNSNKTLCVKCDTAITNANIQVKTRSSNATQLRSISLGNANTWVVSSGTFEDYYCDIFVRAGVTLNNALLQPMLLEGTFTTSNLGKYQPYNEEQAQIVELSSKNLFNGQLELGTYTNSGVKDNSTTNYRNKDIILVQPNTTYTFSINGVSQKYAVYYYNKSQTFLSSEGLSTGTFTTPNDCYYINFRCFNADFTSDYASLKIQLELGSSATTYEQYYNYELCKIGNYQDYLYKSNDKWYKKEQIGKARLTGTAQTWEATNTNTSEKKRYRTMDFASVIVAPSQNNEIGKILSNYYTPQVVATAGSYGGHQGISIDTSGYVFINDDNYLNNLNGWKTWLDSVECNIYCVLQTANDIEITNETLIQQLNNIEKLMSYNGTTNISSSGNLPMVLSVSALKGE